MAASGPEAYATLLVTDNYLPGAMVLAHSLRDAGTKKLLVALVTLDSVSSSTVAELATVYDQILPVDRITNPQPANLYLMDRPDLSDAFTKIALWRQTQFSRLVYIDADALCLRAPDELFNLRSTLAAAPDVGWPDIFNTGVMALTPSMGDYYALLAMAQRGISFDGADQGLLNMQWPAGSWERISFAYNCTPNASYQYVPAYRHFQSQISIVHFIGKEKPWNKGRGATNQTSVYGELMGRWWAVYDKHYRFPTQGVDPQKSLVKQYVAGEEFIDYSYSYNHVPPPPPTTRQHSHDSSDHQQHNQHLEEQPAQYEEPMMDVADPVERLERGEDAPKPTVEQRRFEAPQSEWNPAIAPPPSKSRPEAANFPTQTYSMSEDKSLFQAPRYPSPPKDMWYEVPKTPPAAEKPKPLFPWEENQPAPTRVFPDEPKFSPTEEFSSPTLETQSTETIDTDFNDMSISTEATTADSPATPTIRITPSEPFSSYSRTNAWDDMPSISRYVEALQASRRGKPIPQRTDSPRTTTIPAASMATTTTATAQPADGILSPVAEKPRRPSFKLTDFPTAVERPSLPVTPAPVARGLFWAGVDDERTEEQLPSAPGVPPPQEWDPLGKLEELRRRQAEILARGPEGESLDMPTRDMPGAFKDLTPDTEKILGSPFGEPESVAVAGVFAGSNSSGDSGGLELGGVRIPKSESVREEVEVPRVDEKPAKAVEASVVSV